MEIESPQFWKQSRLFNESPLLVDSKEYSALEVVENLAPFISEERKISISQVLTHRTRSFLPILENIYDKGNISAAMRSAEAYGFFEFHIINKPLSLFKTSRRVTQGTHKWMDIVSHSQSSQCIEPLKEKGYKIYCTRLEGSRPISEINFSQKTALVFGNEKDGVSEEIESLCDGNLILPMNGFAQSFNVSVAAALSFYHVYNDRLQRLGRSGDLTEEQQLLLKANYYLKSVKRPSQILKRMLNT